MEKWIFTIVTALLTLPGVLLAQTSVGVSAQEVDARQYCRSAWLAIATPRQRLYTACLQEQGQALARLQGFDRQYASQDFYRLTALSYCRNEQAQAATMNLVELSFCLDDEIEGYLDIRSLRRLYGSNRIDKLAGTAVADTGSWAAAAGLLKRDLGLKTIRRATGS